MIVVVFRHPKLSSDTLGLPRVSQDGNGIPDAWEDGVLSSSEITNTPGATTMLTRLAAQVARQNGLSTSTVRFAHSLFRGLFGMVCGDGTAEPVGCWSDAPPVRHMLCRCRCLRCRLAWTPWVRGGGCCRRSSRSPWM